MNPRQLRFISPLLFTICIGLFLPYANALDVVINNQKPPDDCRDIKDLSVGIGPAKNQQDLGWCYAFVAADMLTQKLQESGELKRTERVSALKLGADLYLKNGQAPNFNPRNPQTIASVFDAVRSPTCLSKDLNDDEGGTLNSLFTGNTKKACSVTSVQGDNQISVKDANGRPLLPIASNLQEIINRSWQRKLAQLCRRKIPNVVDLETVKVKAPRPWIRSPTSEKDDDRLTRHLDDALKAGKIAAVTYSAFAISTQVSPNDYHVSSVVGRRYFQDRCQYLVRNTWGIDFCNALQENVSCVSKKPGYIWVSREQLIRNTVTVEYLK